MNWRLAPLLCGALGWAIWMGHADALGQNASQTRRLAPGVLTVIPVDSDESETFSPPGPLVEIVTGRPDLAWDPSFTPKSETLREAASRVILRRRIWNLEFAFKPLRMIRVDVPQPTGKMQRKLIWYMVYRVKYLGADLQPQPEEDRWGNTTYQTTTADSESQRFFPLFVLDSRELGKSYLDRIIPVAKGPIEQRESPGQPLYNTVEITRVPILRSDDRIDRSVWGLVTWEDIDPQIDYFSIYVRGLTNAYRYADPEGAYKPGDPPGTGRQLEFKTLQLNFWRPGDRLRETEDEIRYGAPIDDDPAEQQAILEKYDIETRLDHLWVYR